LPKPSGTTVPTRLPGTAESPDPPAWLEHWTCHGCMDYVAALATAGVAALTRAGVAGLPDHTGASIDQRSSCWNAGPTLPCHSCLRPQLDVVALLICCGTCFVHRTFNDVVSCRSWHSDITGAMSCWTCSVVLGARIGALGECSVYIPIISGSLPPGLCRILDSVLENGGRHDGSAASVKGYSPPAI